MQAHVAVNRQNRSTPSLERLYIGNNSGSLINYKERFRSGERISSSIAESTVIVEGNGRTD